MARGETPAPKQDELQPHPVKDQLPNVSYCITSPPPWREFLLHLSSSLYCCSIVHMCLTVIDVITPEALEIYAAIFNYLIQFKLAAFLLVDVWCCLKVV
ncbi:putative gamma-tubulin complex domain superfamily [Dioscorea sansibarensis]